MKIFFILTFLFWTTGFSAHKKAADMAECVSISKSCEAANFKAGDHEVNGRGLWIDCIAQIAQDKKIAGVTGHTPDEAKKCMAAMKDPKNQIK